MPCVAACPTCHDMCASGYDMCNILQHFTTFLTYFKPEMKTEKPIQSFANFDFKTLAKINGTQIFVGKLISK